MVLSFGLHLQDLHSLRTARGRTTGQNSRSIKLILLYLAIEALQSVDKLGNTNKFIHDLIDVSDEEIAKYGARAILGSYYKKENALWTQNQKNKTLNQIEEIRFWISEQCIRILRTGDINSIAEDFVNQLCEKDQETFDRYQEEYSDNLNTELDDILEQKKLIGIGFQ